MLNENMPYFGISAERIENETQRNGKTVRDDQEGVGVQPGHDGKRI